MFSYLDTVTKIYLIAVCALLGLVMGSALNCLAYRIAHKEKWSGGRSRCPDCGHTLKAADLIPLFSYLFLKGRCRYCGKKISPRYPIAEAMLAVIYVSLLLRYDLSLETVQLVILCSCLFCLSLVDLDIQIIPDRFILIPIVCRLLYHLVMNGFTMAALSAIWYSLWHGLLTGGAVLALSLIMDKVLGKDSMGGGDIKLLFVLGLYFDLPCIFLLVLAACIIGIVLAMSLGAKKGIAFPFGPALALAGWLTLLVGKPITGWYMSLF